MVNLAQVIGLHNRGFLAVSITGRSAYFPGMRDGKSEAGVERMFPFVVRSRTLIVGRDVLRRSKRKLHFVLITKDISENGRAEILRDFADYPIIQCYSSADLEAHFSVKGTKVAGFKKSGLAQSIYAELKQHRINKK